MSSPVRSGAPSATPARRALALRAEGLAALSGVLLALSFPKFGQGAVAFLALVPLLVAIAGRRGRGAAGLGYLTGAVWALGTLYWTALVVAGYGGLSWPAGLVAMSALCLAVALFPAVFAWMLGRWVRAFGTVALLGAPVAWVATELVRTRTFFRFPWCLLGYTQQAHLALLQVASLAGVYGLSFLVAGVGAALAYAVVESEAAPRRRALVGAGLVLAAAWGWGSYALRLPEPDGPRLRVGLIQASIPQEQKWDADRAWENLRRHQELTREAAADGARLVAWPESSTPGFFDTSPILAAQMGDLARELGIYLLFGNDDYDGAAHPPHAFVGAKMLDPSGELVLRYHKVRLVPFGEYVPMKPLITLGGRYAARVVRSVADFAPGEGPVVAPVDGSAVGAFICYEAIFPDLVRDFVSHGARLLVNVTNDGWYGRTSAPYQHFAMARVRAVETGRYLVRAANTGISAVIDPRGRILARTELFERRALVGDVRLLSGTTVYGATGDALAWACLAAAFTLTVMALRGAAGSARDGASD